MTVAVILSLCVLILLGYVFDLTASKTRVPSVILLLLMGWIVRQIVTYLDITLPDFNPILPILGTIGLILIVLEGSLELELNKSKLPVLRKSLLGALIPLVALAFVFTYIFSYGGTYDLKIALVNALPLCVISSAIAIPSAANLLKGDKEFIIYESSLSDIIGVVLFNFLMFNTEFNFSTFGGFFLQLLVMLLISIVATFGLSLLLSKIEHHIKFIPIIIMVVLIYEIAKVYHLPSLIFIMILGLVLGNIDELNGYEWIKKFKTETLNKEIHKFTEITIEGAFLIRVLFFLLFGYLIETEELLNTDTLLWALAIVVSIFLFRAIQLKISGLKIAPLLFIAPRGLITILLYISIDPQFKIAIVNKPLIIQVILMTALVMMFGLIFTKVEKPLLTAEKEVAKHLDN